MRNSKIMAAGAAAAVLLSGPGTAWAATPAAPATVTRAFGVTTDDFANPGRGFFTYTETHLADGVAYEPLDADDLAAARTGQARSLVYRIFYLERYRDTDTISATDLALIRADFAAARAAGVKMVIRFAYSADSDADAPAARIVKQLGQLGPILKANADVITALQAGFIGRWGEWYYTQNFAKDTNWVLRTKVMNALLAATGPDTPIQLRTPAYKRRLAANVTRVGIHDDCFLADATDSGTFQGDDRAWTATQSANFLVGGETCAVSDYSGWANAMKDMTTYHWSYLNPSFNQDVLASWGDNGLFTAARRLGYRLRLLNAVLPATAKTGTTATVTMTLTNDGFAAPAQNRPVQLVVLTGTTRKVVTLTADVRTWQPGKQVTLTAKFPAPAANSRLFLSLPDPSASLAANPAYAVRLANVGVWDATTGLNALGTLAVTK